MILFDLSVLTIRNVFDGKPCDRQFVRVFTLTTTNWIVVCSTIYLNVSVNISIMVKQYNND
jgi:hypothetical protein